MHFWKGAKNWEGPSPNHWDKIQKKAFFLRRTSLRWTQLYVRVVGMKPFFIEFQKVCLEHNTISNANISFKELCKLVVFWNGLRGLHRLCTHNENFLLTPHSSTTNKDKNGFEDLILFKTSQQGPCPQHEPLQPPQRSCSPQRKGKTQTLFSPLGPGKSNISKKWLLIMFNTEAATLWSTFPKDSGESVQKRGYYLILSFRFKCMTFVHRYLRRVFKGSPPRCLSPTAGSTSSWK